MNSSDVEYALASSREQSSLQKSTSPSEPERLRRGKSFHRKVQAEWKKGEGEIVVEKSIVKPSGRRGRIDVFVVVDDRLVAIAEIKDSNWDAMTESAIRRNVKRQSRQIWDYIKSQLTRNKDVSPGVIFPQRPEYPNRLAIIETLFEDEGIPVIWEDESIEERKKRS